MSMKMQHAVHGDSIADILERVLDKGVVVAGDVSVGLVGIELLTIKLRLVVCSVDKARELGIDWWQHDPYLSSQAGGAQVLPRPMASTPAPAVEARETTDLAALEQRLALLESRIATDSVATAPPVADPSVR